MIRIGFSKPNHWMIGAKLISMWMNRHYSHCYLRFESSTIQPTVYHATGKMLHFLDQRRFDSVNETVVSYDLPMTSEQRTLVLRKCVELAGVKYGFLELGKILASDIYNVFTGNQLPFVDSKGYICSELVADILTILNVKFTKPANLLKPSDIEQAIKDHLSGQA